MLPNVDSIAARLRLKQLRLLIALDEHRSLHCVAQPDATKALREIAVRTRVRGSTTPGAASLDRNRVDDDDGADAAARPGTRFA
ncbi:hypothetical protein AB4Y32_26505 [Paraburkholderia phymatum]|uniref:Uncharacterized protein n=1 Tax=Paraburkholderia phymatum TaxID=148447 RepID=A0ACC6U6P7_9BURK